MPQMSPYNWLMMFLIFIVFLALVSIMIYTQLKNNHPKKFKKMKKKINKFWKW
nr:ATP synthase F0 subunit 8 [Xorides funiuensis]